MMLAAYRLDFQSDSAGAILSDLTPLTLLVLKVKVCLQLSSFTPTNARGHPTTPANRGASWDKRQVKMRGLPPVSEGVRGIAPGNKSITVRYSVLGS